MHVYPSATSSPGMPFQAVQAWPSSSPGMPLKQLNASCSEMTRALAGRVCAPAASLVFAARFKCTASGHGTAKKLLSMGDR